jgi:NAD(P)-dependent dehydrogenase (short-subunit alcohol dehydrogenase family)
MNDEPLNAAPRYPDLAGRVAIVSGASRGIGCGIAAVLGRERMRLVLTARSAEQGEAVAQALRQTGVEAAWVTADVATADGARMVFQAALDRFGRVDLLVNNAAQLHSAPFLQLDEPMYRDSFERNVRIVYELSLLAARQMAAAQGGSIIHISSVGGLRSHRGLAGYDASKGAIDALTRSMSLDLAPHGIRVNAVAPGAIHTRPGPADHRPAAGIPLGRLGRCDEIGEAVAFLASDAAAYVTGQVLYVDGGLTTQLTPPNVFI